MSLPAVFIGSSREGLKVARTVKELLNEDAEVTVWDEDDSFKPGQSTLESLMVAAERYDFAILVFTADDKVTSRGAESLAPRDNVLFELGLFMGKLGRERTFVLYDVNDELKVPSDFKGINCPTYRSRTPNLKSDLGVPCHKISGEIERLGHYQKNTLAIEAGVLYRLLNVFTSTSYPDIKMQVLGFVRHREVESIAYIGEVIEFSKDLFSDYLHPHLMPSELKSLRVYFAYYLGDGVPLNGGETPTSCGDIDHDGNPFDGPFVVGISNSDKFVEKGWLQGRALSGYDGNRALSNCASVFQTGIASYKPDLSKQSDHSDNFKVKDEMAVSTHPVEWRTSAGIARLGVLAVSSKHPNSIHEIIQERTKALATIIGFLLSQHANYNQSELDAETIDIIMDKRQLIGFDRNCEETFIRRVIGLRQKIAAEFEKDLIRDRKHDWDGVRLTVRRDD